MEKYNYNKKKRQPCKSGSINLKVNIQKWVQLKYNEFYL